MAHTDFGTVDVIDAESLSAIRVIGGCPEGSGVLCAGEHRLVFAASRGGGKVLLIDADRLDVVGEFEVGPKPNGLAWDPGRRRLLVADVGPADQSVRLMGVPSSGLAARTQLPGRPRWCVFDERGDRFLVNIRDPAALLCIAAESGEITQSWPISSAGPHGLAVDPKEWRAFVACDGGQLVVLDLESGTQLNSIQISGVPDAIWFNPLRKRVYVAVGMPGLIDVVDTERGVRVDSIPTEAGATTSAFDVERQRLYVFLPVSCTAAVFEETP